jgi:molybdopterin converting factor small subunit
MNQVKVLFFATLKERAGGREMLVELDEHATIRDLKSRLGRQLPSLALPLETALASIDREFAFEDEAIPAGAEVAFFPPVSGG